MSKSAFLGGAGRIPRFAFILVVLLIGAAVALFFVSRRTSSEGLVLGGPLLDLENKTIEGFLLTSGGAQYRFDKNEAGYWTLRGGLSDFLSQPAVATFLSELEKAGGGRVLAGTVPEDRRFEFNSPGALRFTVFTSDGKSQTLALGVANPVTGYYYASGFGRPGCFPVTEVLQNRLTRLAASLQLAILLPHFDREVIRQVELWYGPQMHLLRRMQGRWWLRQPDKGVDALGNTIANTYHQLYGDRSMERDGQQWLLAEKATVDLVVYQSSDIIIKDFPSSRLGQGRIQEWDLDPPWRRVKLTGAGINPDSTEADPDVLEIAFGTPVEEKNIPVLRRGNVMMTEIEAISVLSSPLGNFLDDGAVSFLVAEGDSIRIFREGEMLLSGHRGPAPSVAPGAHRRPTVESWRTTYPTRKQRPLLKELSYQGLVRNLVVNLDRLEIESVWPEVHDPRILSDKERVVIEVNFGRSLEETGTEPGIQRLEFGFLVAEHWPAGSLAPPTFNDGSPPVAMWNPATGKLLQVTDQILVTMRNHFTVLNRN